MHRPFLHHRPSYRLTTQTQFERYYNVTDKAILGWDRAVGNLLEQAMPFLTLFWLNVGLAALGATDYKGVATAGWIYVVFRALYPVSATAGSRATNRVHARVDVKRRLRFDVC